MLEQSPITQSKRGNPNFAKKEEVKGEQTSELTEDVSLNVGFDIDINKTYIFETIKKSDTPRSENLGSSCRIYDSSKKRYRELRYISVAPSIFKDEQHESYDDYPMEPLMFYRNELLVQGSNRRLMEYLLNHDLYEHSPFRISNKPAFFTLVDKKVQEEIKAKKHQKEFEALEAIKNMPIEDLKPIARIIFGITEEDDMGVVNAMNAYAKQDKKGSEQQSNAEKILDNVGNPKLIRKYNIQTALDRGIITADPNKMQVKLVETNQVLCNLTNAKNPKTILEELTSWSFTKEGEAFYMVVRQKL